MNEVDKKLQELGIELAAGPAPLANYVPVQKAGDLLFFSGALPMKDGKLLATGKLGADLDVDEGYALARQVGINLLANLKKAVDGDWDKVEQIVKVNGVVACAPDFTKQPAVINGVSDLLVEVFGDRGRHARLAMGTNALPVDSPVEVEMIVKLK